MWDAVYNLNLITVKLCRRYLVFNI